MRKAGSNNCPMPSDVLEMRCKEKIPFLKCKKCKDIFIASGLRTHFCYSQNIECKSGTDPNRQCCVMEQGVPCSNSILCKTHKLEEKIKIPSRLYSVNLLIQIVKKENQLKKNITEPYIEPVENQDLQKAFKIINDLRPVINYQLDPDKDLSTLFSKLIEKPNTRQSDDKKKDGHIKRRIKTPKT